jgi:hypothetical protein
MPPGWKDGKEGRAEGRPGQLYGDGASQPPQEQEEVQVRGKAGREMVMQVIYRADHTI